MNQNWISFLQRQGFSTATAADELAGPGFGALQDELLAARDGTIVAPLTDLGLIRLSGDEAAGFLHNLLTNDVNGIDLHTARYAGFCTAKGRLLALLLIWREGSDLLLMLPREILPLIQKKLSMYVLRSKVTLSDASDERVLIGVATRSDDLPGGAAGAVPPEPTFVAGTAPGLARFGVANTADGQLIRLDDRRWIVALTAASAASHWPSLLTDARPVGLAAWHWREIVAGQPQVLAATQEAFVPQMLNLELPAVGAVSFTKGCYPGQEIVARTQYLGKVKRRTFRARLASAPLPGSHVYAPATGDQHCGAIVRSAPSPAGGFEVLVCVQLSAVEAGEVRVGTPDGERLSFLPLPYEVDTAG